MAPSDSTDTTLAALSAYVMSIPLSEQLWCLCAWDCLSDTILLTDTLGYISEERCGLAPIVCSTICYALSHLFGHADYDTSMCSTRSKLFH